MFTTLQIRSVYAQKLYHLLGFHDAAAGRNTGHSWKIWKPRSKPWNPVANQLSQEGEPSVRARVLHFWVGYHVISMEFSWFPPEKYGRHENRNPWKPVEKIINDSLVPLIL